MIAREIAERGLIHRVVVGSSVHGLAVAGTDDRDEMGVCVEPPEYVLGLGRFESYVQRDQPDGVRSQPGDLDLTVYGLRKYCRLAASGNPTVLLLLFTPDEFVVHTTPIGQGLVNLAPAFASLRILDAFGGYMRQQLSRLTGESGQ